MASYQHMDLVERTKIKTLRLQGMNLRDIGKVLGRSHTTISRELNRNHQGHEHMSGYVPELAQILFEKRQSKAHQRGRLKSPKVREVVQEKLKQSWTPEQIAADLPNRVPGISISHEAIYQYIYKDYREGILLLARSHKQRYPRHYSKKSRAPKIKNRVDIDFRPEEINQRKVFGHWESDSIVSKSGTSAIHVILERVSRRVFINKLSDKSAESTRKAIVNSLSKLTAGARVSITYDNGSENYYHEEINKELNTESYFCKPYHSWEKGAVENMNELIRRFIPKKTNLDTITEEQLKMIETQINNRPKKCLEFKTPAYVFSNYYASLNATK
jgi:transposase, IS30 family